MWPSKCKIWKPQKGGQHIYIDTQHQSTNSCILGNKRPLCRHNSPLATLPQGMKNTHTHTHTHTRTHTHTQHTHAHTHTHTQRGPWLTLRVIQFSTSRIYVTTISPQRNPNGEKRIIFSPTSINRKSPNISLSHTIRLLNYATELKGLF